MPVSPDPLFLPPDRTPVASVVDHDDGVVAFIYLHTELFFAEADLFVTVVTVDGDIDSDVAAHLEHVLLAAVDRETPVCCDLSLTWYFGAAGARVILSAHERAAETGSLFLLRGVHGMSRQVLDAVGLDQTVIIK